MQNNINNTNVNLLKKQVNDMIDEIYILNIELNIDVLKKKYSDLFYTSKTLFNMITKKEIKDLNMFKKNIHKMLELILNIQNGKISQNKASEEIGTLIAKQYIPENILNDKPL